MKVLVNGGINLSELDGWWTEAYNPKVGWALGDGKEHGDDPAWDAAEAETLYDLLEHEIVPEFYTRDERGIPPAWIARIRESLAHLTPRYSADRSVREYTDQHYRPSAEAYRARAANNGAFGRQIVDWQRTLDKNWGALHFGEVKNVSNHESHCFEEVRVELFADGLNGRGFVRREMTRLRQLSGSGRYIYAAHVLADRPSTDYTPRIVPYHAGVSVPLETPYINWQR